MRCVAAGAAIAVLAAGCARPVPTPAPPPPPPVRDIVALAPDPDTGDVGRLTVTTPGGSVELAERYASTTVATGASPSPPATMTEEEVQTLFGPALAVQPPAALRFLLYFELGGDTLTPASRAQLPAVLAAVSGRVAPDVQVVGHTDTTGQAAANAKLGLQRASLIRDQLLQAGLDPSLLEVASHGESDLLVPTDDNIAEARNRRVEVIVR
jgi:outer membrane protein OmpA-like peptidoglycan-associated protein